MAKFKFNEEVRIINGFYKGKKGYVKSYQTTYTYPIYKVRIFDTIEKMNLIVEIYEKNLEKLE